MSHNTVNYRERESKFLVQETWTEALAILRKLYPDRSKELIAQTIDDYWELPNKASFLRLRSSWGYTGDGERRTLREVTVKCKDKGDNLDRIEVNAGIGGVKDMRALLRVALGKKAGRICKTEWVYFDSGGMVLSLSRIKGRLYIEIESSSKTRNLARSFTLLRKLKMTREPRSLFEIYLKEPKS